MKRAFRLLCLALLLSGAVFSQDKTSLFNYNNLLNLNPSFAGINQSWRGQATYQNEMPNVSANRVFYDFTCHGYLPDAKAGIGVSYQNNNYHHNVLRASSTTFIYAQHLQLMDKSLRLIPSVGVSYFKRNLDVGALTYGDQFDPEWGVAWTNLALPPKASLSGYDAHAGILGIYKNFYGGIAVKHINQPDIGHISTLRLPTEFLYHLAYTQKLDAQNLIQYSFIYRNQGPYNQARIMTNAILNRFFIFGLGLGSEDVLFANAGIRGKHLAISLAHERNYRSLNNALTAWQLVLAFSFSAKTPTTGTTSFESW